MNKWYRIDDNDLNEAYGVLIDTLSDKLIDILINPK